MRVYKLWSKARNNLGKIIRQKQLLEMRNNIYLSNINLGIIKKFLYITYFSLIIYKKVCIVIYNRPLNKIMEHKEETTKKEGTLFLINVIKIKF